ncbi:ABC transporter ATP-binding protein [Microbacterium sp. NPDC016588]
MPDDGIRLRLHAVGHRWKDGPPLFGDVDLDLGRGDVVALTGPSGSGKSTLLSIVAGWLVPSTGRIDRVGIRRIHWVFQNPHGQPRRATRDHVSYPFLLRGASRQDADDRADHLLDRFGLLDRAALPFSDLSGGEAQRLLLARAVAVEPDLLLVDEPTAQLDRAAARTVNAVLAGLADAGSIVLIASHDAETIRACNSSVTLGATT